MSRGRGPIDDALDRLYAAPLEGFVALRKELAATVRAAGDVAGAAEVAAAKKPSRTAWALNQVARRHPDALRAVFEAHAAAARTQGDGDAEALRDGVRAYREALAEVVKRSTEVAAEAGMSLGATQARELSETVRAAIGGEARELLLAGRLIADVDVDDPFAGLEVGGGDRKPARRPAAPPREETSATVKAKEREAQRARASQEARERAAEEARRRIAALEAEAREARIAAHQAEVVARRAEAEAERARRVATEVEERLAKAKGG
jgi:hypothetical protein